MVYRVAMQYQVALSGLPILSPLIAQDAQVALVATVGYVPAFYSGYYCTARLCVVQTIRIFALFASGEYLGEEV